MCGRVGADDEMVSEGRSEQEDGTTERARDKSG
jgi:hypothetical protein